jgi:phage FluMu gp28-like protein
MADSTEKFAALVHADPAKAEAALQAIRKTLFIPHAGGQLEVMQSQARFRVIRAGRRWGKTKVSAREIINAALKEPGSMNWWVANTYKNVSRGYKEVVRQLPRQLLAQPAPSPTANNLVLRLINGSVIEFYSGGSPDALAGEGVDFIVVDEAALIPEAVWYQLIRPTLMDSRGSGMIISTPRGKNWFYKLWMMGQDARKTDYASWHFTSYDNPHIDDEEIREAESTLPHMIYQQEIMAEFLESAASIFHWEDDQVLAGPVDPRGHLFMGVDLGKKEDFTVINVDRAIDRLPCFHDKFNAISWPAQRERIIEAKEYLEALPEVTGLTIGIDSTGLGDVVFDDLEEDGIDVLPFKFTNEFKQKMVMRLAADLERKEASILEEQEAEFGSYEYEITDSGRYKFEAATGHDDEVAAKLLSNWLAVEEGQAPDIKVAEISEREAEPQEAEVQQEIIRPDNARQIMQRADAWNS